MLLLSELQSAW